MQLLYENYTKTQFWSKESLFLYLKLLSTAKLKAHRFIYVVLNFDMSFLKFLLGQKHTYSLQSSLTISSVSRAPFKLTSF